MSRKQEIFDKVVTHLRKQGRKAGVTSFDGEFECMYRTSDGLKCAAGCLIPDDSYSYSFENERVHASPCNHVSTFFAEQYSVGEIRLIGELQDLHDMREVVEWERGFADLADRNSLTLPEATQ